LVFTSLLAKVSNVVGTSKQDKVILPHVQSVSVVSQSIQLTFNNFQINTSLPAYMLRQFWMVFIGTTDLIQLHS